MSPTRILRRVTVILLGICLGCATTYPPQVTTPMAPMADPPPVEAQVENPDLIKVGDQIEVQFPYKHDFDQTQRVREDGKISLPYLEPVEAAGKTPDQLVCELRGLYGALSYNPLLNRSLAARKKYVIAVGDVLQIHFDYEHEYDAQVTVRPDGNISLARVKTVSAEGKTPEELERELTDRYKTFVQYPSLTVVVDKYSSDVVYVDGAPARLGVRNLDGLNVVVQRREPQVVYVTGEVHNPGAFPYNAPMTAMRAIVLAGGYRRTAKLQSVIILRKTDPNGPVALKVNLVPEIEAQHTTDVVLRPYDIVILPKTCVAKVQDILDQYLYDLIPATRVNTEFSFFTELGHQGGGLTPVPAPTAAGK